MFIRSIAALASLKQRQVPRANGLIHGIKSAYGKTASHSTPAAAQQQLALKKQQTAGHVSYFQQQQQQQFAL